METKKVAERAFMIISVSSGKGGTGKTTVATNLAVSIGSGVRFLDCDVEEPNAALFLSPIFEDRQTVHTPVPEVDMEKCNFCGKCASICQFNAIVVIGNTVMPFIELCHGCGGCMAICPEHAITETGRELGIIERGRRGDIEFIHGKLRIGEAMAPPLIERVREYDSRECTTIIDAPPGTSCPVIAAMKHTDFVLLVTEPTPFGLHDLRLAVGAVKRLDIPSGLVINRCDIGDDRVKDYAAEINLPVLMEIPFDRRIAEAYARGQMIVDVIPEYTALFCRLYEKIKAIVEKDS